MMRQLASEPASLILSLTTLKDPEDVEVANSFLAAFEDWCWAHGLLDKWTWNVPFETLLNWTVVETPGASDTLRWGATRWLNCNRHVAAGIDGSRQVPGHDL